MTEIIEVHSNNFTNTFSFERPFLDILCLLMKSQPSFFSSPGKWASL